MAFLGLNCSPTSVLSSFLSHPGEVFHNIGKEDHRHPSTPLAPRNSPTGLPPLNSASLAVATAPATHLPSMGSQPFPKTIAPTPGFMEAHPGLCLSAAEPPSIPGDGPVSAPPSICRSVSSKLPFAWSVMQDAEVIQEHSHCYVLVAIGLFAKYHFILLMAV